MSKPPKPKAKTKICCIKTCEYSAGTQLPVRMFRIPKDEKKAEEWKKAISPHANLNGMICINHFCESDLLRSAKSSNVLLKAGVVPSIFEINFIDCENASDVVEIAEKVESVESNGFARNSNSTSGFDNSADESTDPDPVNYECQNASCISLRLQMHEERKNTFIERMKRDIKITELEQELKTLKAVKKNQSENYQKLNQRLWKLHNAKIKVDKTLGDLKTNNILNDQAVKALEAITGNEVLNCLVHGIKSNEKYPAAVRKFCFALSYHSPAAYETVRDQFNKNLPHSKTLKAWLSLSDLNGEPGVTQGTLNRLKGLADKLKEETGEQLCCSLIFDEMNIRQQVLWDENKMEYVGFITYPAYDVRGLSDAESANQDESNQHRIAKKTIIFMLNGINKHFQFPFAYHFVDALSSGDLAHLVKEVIIKITECGVKIANLVMDGAKPNIAMCKILGANLDLSDPNFNPIIENPSDQSVIYLMLDPSHMIKLMRNLLGNHKVLYDEDDNKIKWQYFVDLVNISKDSIGLTTLKTHKLTRKHTDFDGNKMNVRLAAETLSNSVADSMKMLKDHGNKKFADSEATIKFAYKMDILFDILNSISVRNSNVYKNALSEKNKQQIFTFAEECKNYLINLKMLRNGVKSNVYKTISFTPILGFFMDLTNLSKMYAQYVEKDKTMNQIYTYSFSQDHLEILHSKIRARNGCNNNPNVVQFRGAYRRILCNLEIKSPEASNCMTLDMSRSFGSTTALLMQSNIYSISSLRPKLDVMNDEHFQINFENQNAEIYEEFGNSVHMLNDIEKSSHLTDAMSDASIAYAARIIEIRIEEAQMFHCNCCKLVFKVNEKLVDRSIYMIESKKPCVSTFYICKIVDRFVRLYKPNFLSNDCNERDFRVIFYMIFQEIDFDNVYTDCDFKDHEQHKFHLVKCIVQQYIRLKTLQIAKQSTYSRYNTFLRSKLTKRIHFEGQ